jgi:hypothetical protein
MGASGEDLLLSPAARKHYPFSVECKNVEKINIWEAIEQAEQYGHTPLVAFKKNGKETHVAINLTTFMEIYTGYVNYRNGLLQASTKTSTD